MVFYAIVLLFVIIYVRSVLPAADKPNKDLCILNKGPTLSRLYAMGVLPYICRRRIKGHKYFHIEYVYHTLTAAADQGCWEVSSQISL